MLAAGAGRAPSDIALLLRLALTVDSRARAEACAVEVAATHPRLVPRTRTTGGVARDIIRAAHARLLVVGYSATTDPKLTGLASQTLKALAAAAARGVEVTAVLHRQESNWRALQRAWPDVRTRATLYTWPEQSGDEKASLHAKVLVADRIDALVTSANLTYHGFQGNVEMGVRITGRPAMGVAEVFEDLIRAGEFVKWQGR
jgi:phosphatidylserine/phosphatidylglycerophosphate/cardiolipin synthase-like enzyme